MATPELVLIDTCIWVQFFNRPQSREKQAVDELLDDDRGALIGPILTEVLLGFRRDERADWVASLLRGLHFLEVTWDEWRAAARLGRRLMAAGHLLPLSDLMLAAVALERDLGVYSTDPHFDLIPELKRYSP
ncbi:MAG TPA: PIN domain-containing protein [Gemmataceae bacterium]|jgi:predicted nucleic acid-binding protein|nr:PIN domain-containing protein [Gemmataceae bacterium]